jgi:hypothetical protein
MSVVRKGRVAIERIGLADGELRVLRTADGDLSAAPDLRCGNEPPASVAHDDKKEVAACLIKPPDHTCPTLVTTRRRELNAVAPWSGGFVAGGLHLDPYESTVKVGDQVVIRAVE